MKVSIGRAKVTITAEGCVKCGTKYAKGWYRCDTLLIVVGSLKKARQLDIHICADCAEQENLTALEKIEEVSPVSQLKLI